VSELKKLIQERTSFPVSMAVILLGCKRLHDELSMARVAAAAEASGNPLQLHLSASGALAFLRREGQGHREQSGSKTLTLLLPMGTVSGARERPMPFDPEKSLSDLRWSIQAISGLTPARMKLSLGLNGSLKSTQEFSQEDEAATLHNLGFEDGCTLHVEQTDGPVGDFDMPIDIPSSGPASVIYASAAAKLGLGDASKLALFAGSELVNRNADLTQAAIADGVILSAYVNWPLQLSISVLGNDTLVPGMGASSSSSEASGEAVPNTVAARSCDTVADVRERLLGATGANRSEAVVQLRGSQVFIVEKSSWRPDGGACLRSLEDLERLLGHFRPCSDAAKLSRLGIADGSGHLIFVPKLQLSVEIEVFNGSEEVGTRKLRVPSTTKLSELSFLLLRSLREKSLSGGFKPGEFSTCRWAFLSADSPESPKKSSVAAVLSKVKRKSCGGSPEAPPEKRRKIAGRGAEELEDGKFVGDLHSKHPTGSTDLQRQFLCPISYEVMRDPVLVVGSGNTYDRKSIERHFQYFHRDPLNNTELRRPQERRLVPNNSLRSQIDEAERSQVDLRLAAFISGSSSFCSGDAPMAAYLSWCANLLSR